MLRTLIPDTVFITFSINTLITSIESTANLFILVIALASGILSLVLKYRQVRQQKDAKKIDNCPFKHICKIEK